MYHAISQQPITANKTTTIGTKTNAHGKGSGSASVESSTAGALAAPQPTALHAATVNHSRWPGASGVGPSPPSAAPPKAVDATRWPLSAVTEPPPAGVGSDTRWRSRLSNDSMVSS